MSQCVPSWDLDDNPTQLKLSFSARSNSSNSFVADVPSLDYEVAELTWENGQLAMYGLGPPRVLNKPAAAPPATWDKPRAADTLESIVDQATFHPQAKSSGGGNKLVPWLDHRHAAATNVDALVPCRNTTIRRHDNQENPTHVPGTGGTCMVGSCSGGGCLARAGRGCCKSYASAGESATCGGGDSRQVTLDSCDKEFGGGGLTSTSLWSPENTSSGEDYTKTSAEDHDSVFRSRSQRQAGDKGNRKGIGKTSISAKSRAAAVHNQSERRRRNKINQRMKTLQKLVPNSSKTDKASMLDEVIEYLKQLQAQVHVMSRMNMPSMNIMMPLPMQQQLQMSMMTPTMGMGMGMGVMDINAMGRAAAMPPMMPPAATAATAFMPMPSWDIHAGDRLQFPPLTPDILSTFIACQAQAQAQAHAQPMTVDAYSRLAALYQQFQQSAAGSGSKN